MTMTLAVCPPDRDRDCMRIGRPTRRHSAQRPIRGHLERYGSERAVLENSTTRFVPPGVCRAFRTSATKKDILQVLITGGGARHDDIDFAEEAKRKIEAIGRGLLKESEAGFTFTAGGLVRSE